MNWPSLASHCENSTLHPCRNKPYRIVWIGFPSDPGWFFTLCRKHYLGLQTRTAEDA